MIINSDFLLSAGLREMKLDPRQSPPPDVRAYMRLRSLLKVVELYTFRRPGGLWQYYSEAAERFHVAKCRGRGGDEVSIFFAGLAGRMGFRIESTANPAMFVRAVFADCADDVGRVGFDDVEGDLEELCDMMVAVVAGADELRTSARPQERPQ